MRSPLPRILLLLALWLPALALGWQPGWTPYTNGINVTDIALSGDAAWIATRAGLVYHRPATGETTRYDTANSGLPGNIVEQVAVDPRGRVWAATPQGLARYDGADWKTWDSTSPGYPFRAGDRRIGAMTFDLWGDLWIAARTGFVAQFDGVTWTIHDTSAGYSKGFAQDIETDANGDVWVATSEGLCHWDWGGWTVLDTSVTPGAPKSIFALDIDIFGNVWTLSGRSLVRFDGSQWSTLPVNLSLGDDRVQSFHDLSVDPWGSAWIATRLGLLRIDIDSAKMLRVHRDDIAQVETDGEGNTWVGRTGGSVGLFDGYDWSDVALPNTNPALASNDIGQVEVARDGAVWVDAGGSHVSTTASGPPSIRPTPHCAWAR